MRSKRSSYGSRRRSLALGSVAGVLWLLTAAVAHADLLGDTVRIRAFGDPRARLDEFVVVQEGAVELNDENLWAAAIDIEADSITLTVVHFDYVGNPELLLGFFGLDAGDSGSLVGVRVVGDPIIRLESFDGDELVLAADLDGDIGQSITFFLEFSDEPDAQFTFGQVGETREVDFDASFSTDPDDPPGVPPPLRYEWDFDGEGTSIEFDPLSSFTFAEFGRDKTVTLRVVDDEGDDDTTQMTFDLMGAPPEAFFTDDPSILDPLERFFDATFSIPSEGADDIVSYEWEFGDGATSSAGPQVSHVYPDLGLYTVKLTITDDLGFDDESEREIDVGGAAGPVPDFSFEQQAFPPFEVELIGSDTLSDLTAIQGFEWEFGDGSPDGLGKIQFHRYPGPGSYDVTLTAEILTSETFDRTKKNRMVGNWGVFESGPRTALIPPDPPDVLPMRSDRLPPGLAPKLVTVGWPVIFPGGVGRVTSGSSRSELDGVPIARVGDLVGECRGSGCSACDVADAGSIDPAANSIDEDGTAVAAPGGLVTLSGACGPGVAILAACPGNVPDPTLADLEADGCLPFDLASVLASAATAGETSLDADGSGLAVGDLAVLAPGTPRQEAVRVTGFGSVLLADPLLFDHPAGDEIVVFDADGDGISDGSDNCRLVANPGQADANAAEDDDASRAGSQSYGDACDADLDEDGVVGPSDFFSGLRPCFGADLGARPECAEADLNADGVVGPSDFFGGLRPALGSQPGPGRTTLP